MEHARKKLEQWLSAQRDSIGFLVSKPENIFWLTGFQGSFSFFLQEKSGGKYLITDSRYAIKARKICEHERIKFLLFEATFSEKFGKKFQGIWALEDTTTIAQGKRMNALFPQVQWKTTTGVLEKLRRQKTKEEILNITKAQNQVDKILLPFVHEKLRPGISERTVAFDLECAIRDHGKFELSFDPIVAFGQNSAIPHHSPTDQKLKRGDVVLIDCGAKYKGYCSDMTRTFGYGKVSNEFFKKYELLLSGQCKALASFIRGTKTSLPDEICRKILGREAQYFTHSLGHGVGLEIHESPSIRSEGKPEDDFFQENEVVTCEPGLYYAGKFGIRIEDLVLITDKKPRVLSRTPKERIIF